ncbi:MAG: hypothetical protein K2P52_08445 [Campylobacterales bacterium]|nr:hypothetical protein [Campylobacterales bacterium]
MVLTRLMYATVVLGIGASTAVTFGSADVLTYNTPVAIEFRPTTNLRNGRILMVVDTIVQLGFVQVDTSGIMKIGPRVDSSGVLQNFDIGNQVNILDCSTTYTYD